MSYKSFTNGFAGRVVLLTRALSATALILILAQSGLAQKGEEPRSFSLNDRSQDQVDRKVLPKIDPERLLAEDRARTKNPIGRGPARFAVAAEVAFTLKNAGTWQNLPDGRLWRLRMQSPGTRSMNLGITRFDMTEGAKLWIYDPGHKNVEGPFTARDRSHKGRLWTPIIIGDEIVVEIFVPKGIRDPVIQIGAVNRGYRDLGGPGDLILSCENDVICPEGDPWRDQIRSVARYSISGTGFCSGQLMNNTSLDFTPYFLSANHCGVSSANDDTLVFYWNFESPNCGDHGGGSLAENQTGAIFRASSAPSDFLLVELEEDPDPSFNVFFSGWDRSGTASPSTVGIHHPNAEVKSISFNTNAITSTDNGSNAVNATSNHWRVDSFEDGAVEHGSSGSCLWDAATKRCIGQLHSGFPNCPGGPYWYGKLSIDWTGGGTNSTRLSNWLDPGSTGVSSMDGDTHITAADGTRYDFQGAGEFISVRDADGLEIQTRMTPIGTTFTPGADPYSGIATCVSINSAVAARVGKNRVTIQPNISGVPDPSGLQVRVDGALTTVGAGGIALGPGARIDKIGDAFRVNFPNGTVLVVTPLFWSSQGKWFLNVEVFRSGADGIGGGSPGGGGFPGGLMAALAPGSWLPALSDGTSLGPMPGALHQRFVDLYQKLGESWRVTEKTTLFDYGPGTSTDTFTDRSWPRENGSCSIPGDPPVKPIKAEVALRLCREVADKDMNAHCVFDVVNTGESDFARLYRVKQRVRNGFTNTTVNVGKSPVPVRERVTFTATVERRAGGKGIPDGTVQFVLDGRNVGEPVPLDKSGRGRWTTSDLYVGEHNILASYAPSKGSVFLASSGRERVFTVTEK
jgi:lysyl endopeptidase